MKCLYAKYEVEKPLAKATMCNSIRRAVPFVEHLQKTKTNLLHKYKRKRSNNFFTCAVLLSHRG